MTVDSHTFFGFEWGGWCFTYNTIPFGWKLSPYVYQATGMVATNYFRSIRIPRLLYIDDRHNGQLQVNFSDGPYVQIPSLDGRNLAAANAAIFLVAYTLIRLGYFLGLKKSNFNTPQNCPISWFSC